MNIAILQSFYKNGALNIIIKNQFLKTFNNTYRDT